MDWLSKLVPLVGTVVDMFGGGGSSAPEPAKPTRPKPTFVPLTPPAPMIPGASSTMPQTGGMAAPVNYQALAAQKMLERQRAQRQMLGGMMPQGPA